MRSSKSRVIAVLISCGLVPLLLPRLLEAQQANNKSQPGAPSISYTLPKSGEVTLGIYDQQGKLLRTVLSAESRTAGKLTDSWNGLDQWGKPIPAGSYTLRGIYHPPLTTNYVMSFGNPGNPPWPTMDGKGDWLSDERVGQAAATDGKWVFLAATGSEKGSAVMAVDEKGQKQWGVIETLYPVAVSLAVDGDYLYALFSGPHLTDATLHYQPGGKNAIGRAVLMCFDKHTGRAAKFSITDPAKQVATWPFTGKTVGLWELRTQKTFSPKTYNGQPRYDDIDVGETTNAIGLAVANKRIYLAMHDDNQLLVLDADTAAKVDTIPVPAPAGLYAEAGGRGILAVSDTHIVRINPANKQSQTVISTGLVAPRCVTEDAKNRIFVSDWGTSFQVKAFSPAGALLHAIGKEGGRPWVGPWMHDGMLVPTGIAVGGDGNLWVVEDDSSPRRISLWNPDSGAFVNEYLGPTPYAGPGSILDPKDATDASGMGARFKIDMTAKTWTPKAILERRMDINQPFTLNGAAPDDPGQKILFHNNDEYRTVVSPQGLVIHKRHGDVLVPVAAIGTLHAPENGDGTAFTVFDSDLGFRVVPNFYPPFFAGHLGENYTWSDGNGDGLVQPGEMAWFKTLAPGAPYTPGTQPVAHAYWGFGIDNNWSIYWAGFLGKQAYIFRMDVKSWSAEGAPIYDIHDSKAIVVRDSSSPIMGLFGTTDGKVIATYDYEGKTDANAIECFDRDGKSLWSLAMPKPPPAGNGQGPKDILAQSVIQEFKLPGIGNVLGGWLWHANGLPYLFTDDGLYVDALLGDTQVGPGATYLESYKAYYQDPRGVPYIINGGIDAFHILRIDGLDQGGRFEQPFTFTPQDFAKAAAFRSTPVVKPPPMPILNVTWAPQAPAIDGNLADWNMHYGATLQGGKNRSAQVALSRDANNLYLAYQVTKDRPFSNKGENWQTLFISGDCVDLMLASDSASASQHSPTPGDERLLISMYQGKPIAVLYHPDVPGTKQPIQLMAARLDEIKQLPFAKIAIVPSGNSYTVEAAVPLKDLSIDPKALGVALQGDVGVIFADANGTSRALRLYYYNKQTTMVADLSTEATLQPAEWGTVQFPLGNNMIKNGGFEAPLATTHDLGWFKLLEHNGAGANVSTVSPHSGAQSLQLTQTKPVVYPASALTTAVMDYQTMTKTANNGAGGGQAMVEQRVPVVAGHSYYVRFSFRLEKTQVNTSYTGPERGYSGVFAQLGWGGTNIPAAQSLIGLLDSKAAVPDWKTLTNPTSSYQLVPKPYRAPDGANAMVIRFTLTTFTPDYVPAAFVDDVEVVDAGVVP